MIPSRPRRSTASTVKKQAGQKLPYQQGTGDDLAVNAKAAAEKFQLLWTTHKGGAHTTARIHKGLKGYYLTTGRHSVGSSGDPLSDEAAKRRAHARYEEAVSRILNCYADTPDNARILDAADNLLKELGKFKEVRKDKPSLLAALND